MGILTRQQIIKRLVKGELLLNAHKTEKGDFDVEPASYDLHAGVIIWKEYDPLTENTNIKRVDFNPSLPACNQETVHLQPGQVMFVITKEEVVMPKELCGTVYAKNKFSRDGILALTTGHIDPGIQCPIVIRLINLRAIPYTFQLGEPIYTIVFHNLEFEPGEELSTHPPITMQQTISNTLKSADAALANALNDLSLTHNFVRKDEFQKLQGHAEKLIKEEELGKLMARFFWRRFWALILGAFAIVGAIAAIVKIIEHFNTTTP